MREYFLIDEGYEVFRLLPDNQSELEEMLRGVLYYDNHNFKKLLRIWNEECLINSEVDDSEGVLLYQAFISPSLEDCKRVLDLLKSELTTDLDWRYHKSIEYGLKRIEQMTSSPKGVRKFYICSQKFGLYRVGADSADELRNHIEAHVNFDLLEEAEKLSALVWKDGAGEFSFVVDGDESKFKLTVFEDYLDIEDFVRETIKNGNSIKLDISKYPKDLKIKMSKAINKQIVRAQIALKVLRYAYKGKDF